jgi:uncharacterized repeat protein (TIGR01451 family)
VVFYHTLANIGNGTDSFALSAASRAGWPTRIYIDANGSGGLDAGDPQVSGPIPLAADDTAHVLIAVDVPGSAAVRGVTDTVDVQAASLFDGTATDQLVDEIQVRDAGIVVNLSKSVDRLSATIGDVLTYTITYDAVGPSNATNHEIVDLIPLGSQYVPGTLQWNGAALTDVTGDDEGIYDAGGNRVVFQLGNISGGDNGTVSFQVSMGSQGDVTNTAASTYQTVVGPDSVASNSVVTNLVLPELVLEKTVDGTTVAYVGEEFGYTLLYGNSSALAVAQSVVVSDTLPQGLDFVSSQPAATVNGQILTWTIGDMAPGDTAQIQITVRVSDQILDTVTVANVGVMSALNASAEEVALAELVQLVNLAASELTLDKAADVLEVGLGETVPYTLTLENTGTNALSDLRIYDRLPEGGAYSQGSAMGVDSVHVDGRDLTFFVAGPLAPGETHTVRYAVAIVSAGEPVLANTAYATAEDDVVVSTEVTAWVRVRSSYPLETRAAIGKVWIDLNGNGGQDSGEPGIPGADIWTEDGEVVSSDSEGKFSYSNLRPGRHAFRLDPATIPVGYRLAGGTASDDYLTLIADGWTSPRINFRLVPRATLLTQVRLPVSWRFTARPMCAGLDEVFPSGDGDRATLAHFESNSARLQDGSTLVRRVALALANSSGCQVEIAGHADNRPIRSGPYMNNWTLSQARADSVARALRDNGFDAQITVRALGASEPTADGKDPYSLWLNRRVEMRLVGPDNGISTQPVVEYELRIDNDYDVALSGLAVRFEPAADSVALVDGDSILVKLPGHPALLPSIDPYSRITLRAWTVSGADSAIAVLERSDRSAGRLAAAVHNYVMPVDGIDAVFAIADTLPSPTKIRPGGTVEVILHASPAGWPEATFQLPPDWEYVEGSVKVGGLQAPDPEIRIDRTGDPVLFWRFRGRSLEPISLHLRPVDSKPVEPVRLPALRSDEERQADQSQAFLSGPAPEIFSPQDGTILRSDKLFVGVRGEPNVPIALFDGDIKIAEGDMRVDGIYDFIAIPLERGPHHLRVRMKNSWGQERWDSLAIHITGAPAEIFTEEDEISLVADGHSTVRVRARVLDRWGVPMVNPTYVTVSAEGATPLGEDTDLSSVGLQFRTDPAGWLQVDLRPGLEIGMGRLTLKADDAWREIELEIVPPSRPLMITGVGQVGIGSAPADFGAVTARGRIDDKTSIILSYDSRLLDGGSNFFGRGYNPLAEAQYPLLGDASLERSMSASDYAFSARVQRGFDFVEVGDIRTSDFSSGLILTSYHRSVTGATAHVTTGPIVWKGFGASTTQSLNTLQIRGQGTSGPYGLQPNIRPGTERISIETRARDNAERTLSQQGLVRYIDYQIDYLAGTIIFKRPIPAADPNENPVFIVVSYEAETGGEREAVWGVRAAAGIKGGAVDSLRIGGTYISDDQSIEPYRLAGADLRMISYGALDVGAEVSYSETADSADIATSVDGSLRLFGGIINLSGGYMLVGDEYSNPSNPGLRAGTEEIRAGGGLRIGPSELRVEHESQLFKPQAVRRERTSGGIVQRVGSQLQLDAFVARDRFDTGGSLDESQAGEAKITWTPTSNFSLWTDGRYQFQNVGAVVVPDYFGGGAAFRVSPRLSLEAGFRQVMLDRDSLGYSIGSLGVRSDLGLGTQAYGSYQVAGGISGARNAAIVGLNNQLNVGSAWKINTMFERRFGLQDAVISDPVRALPFLQQEEDYWSAGLGIDLVPQDAPFRLSTRGEFRDGQFRSTRHAYLAGDLSISRSLALLTRNEWIWTEQEIGGGLASSERRASLWGLAFRPIGSDALNVLTKFEWIEERSPFGGGVLTTDGKEQRMIGLAEAIWAPFKWSEMDVRYAVRRTEADNPLETGEVQNLTSWADYLGGRLNLYLAKWVAVRSEGRMLYEHTSGAMRWDASPSLVFIPIDGFEAQGGYRFGDLKDPDFSVRGGEGWYVMFTARLTERVFPTSADFWRSRF